MFKKCFKNDGVNMQSVKMAKSKTLNTVNTVLLLTILCTLTTIKCQSSQHHQHIKQSSLDNAPYPQPWEQLEDSGSSSSSYSSSPSSSSLHSSAKQAISSSTYYHTSGAVGPPPAEPVLCLLRGISIEQTRNQSRNFYECPGRWPAEFIECCEDNQCCAPNYVRQYLQEK